MRSHGACTERSGDAILFLTPREKAFPLRFGAHGGQGPNQNLMEVPTKCRHQPKTGSTGCVSSFTALVKRRELTEQELALLAARFLNGWDATIGATARLNWPSLPCKLAVEHEALLSPWQTEDWQRSTAVNVTGSAPRDGDDRRSDRRRPEPTKGREEGGEPTLTTTTWTVFTTYEVGLGVIGSSRQHRGSH